MTIERFKLSAERKNRIRQRLYLTIGLCCVFVLGIAIFANIRNIKQAEKIASLTTARLSVSTPVPALSPTILPVFVIEDDSPITMETTPIPLSWVMPAKGEINVAFSEDELVYNRTMDDWRVHLGVDFIGEIGSSVFAVADGIVTNAGYSDMIGNYIEISHSNGYVSLYANLQEKLAVSGGEKVTKGQIIGGIDRSAPFELADPPHLHFELFKDNKCINPLDVIE